MYRYNVISISIPACRFFFVHSEVTGRGVEGLPAAIIDRSVVELATSIRLLSLLMVMSAGVVVLMQRSKGRWVVFWRGGKRPDYFTPSFHSLLSHRPQPTWPPLPPLPPLHTR